ncbi:MAG TPA: hypothetical protein VF861_13925 [Telluria sp.]
MKPSAWLFSAALSVSCLALAHAAPPKSTVTENTDPAKIAEIERRAQELEASAQSKPAAQKPPVRHEKKKSKAKHKPAKKAKPASDTPMAPETKG